MAQELARFQNFAKLKDTEVAFNDITILAGKPTTGKSYVMKFIYATYESAKLFDKESNYSQTWYNLLNSIFVDINQISDNFKFSYRNLSIETTVDGLIAIDSTDADIDITNTIFVETPLILEFKKFINRKKGKTPYHIESLLDILDTDYSFIDEEQDQFIKDFRKKSKFIIDGDIESSGDSFIFNQNDSQNYDILNTSSGTKSIGLLQYLVTNKALKKGSVLFWEEPEVHLHPEWQLKMVDLFVELMNAGVRVVFSTHSPYMCDYLNAISQKRGFDDRVSFNLFKEVEGVVDNHILKSDEDWNKIQAELLDPLEEIMWEYI